MLLLSMWRFQKLRLVSADAADALDQPSLGAAKGVGSSSEDQPPLGKAAADGAASDESLAAPKLASSV